MDSEPQANPALAVTVQKWQNQSILARLGWTALALGRYDLSIRDLYAFLQVNVS